MKIGHLLKNCWCEIILLSTDEHRRMCKMPYPRNIELHWLALRVREIPVTNLARDSNLSSLYFFPLRKGWGSTVKETTTASF